jgi:tetratricopeptide (TPR) repeat protein
MLRRGLRSRSRYLGPGVLAALILAGGVATRLEAAAGKGETLGQVQHQELLARARGLLEQERLEEAEEALAVIFRRRSVPAEAYLLRSTLLFMEGERGRGREDLDHALELDPGLREGWLNRAALDLSERRLDGALDALLKARDLDPAAVENSLNIGAVLVLMGRADEAASSFADYLERRPGSAEAAYLVASNYGMAGALDPAVQHLRQAIALDERSRLQARTDPNFADLASQPAFDRLLREDAYTPPPGSYVRSRSFDAAYDGGRGRLLQAVMNALQLSGRPMEQRVEVTPDWTLIWSDIRVKVSPTGPTSGLVELSAPAERFAPESWEAETDALLREIAAQLIQLARGLGH